MKSESQSLSTPPGRPGARARRWSPVSGLLLAGVALSALCSAMPRDGGDGDDDDDGDHGNSPVQLREFIGHQVGGLSRLTVPATNEGLPQPRLADGTVNPFFRNTEAKRYLGKLLFHDPIRMVRIVEEFGGIPETAQTASCASCHLAAAATKAGTVINFAAGGEGIGYTDANGKFIPRRRARTDILPRVRATPLFPGDALVDELPTLTDVYEHAIGSPALGQLPGVGNLLRTGRLDAVDSVGRLAPSVIGFAFNNRLLLDGFAGEDDATDGGLNPLGHPGQENLTLLLLDAHRLLSLLPPQPSSGVTSPHVLQGIRPYVKLFRDAFPEEAATGNMDDLINDVTIVRATATFLRTSVTRNTPWDRFLAGDNHALTASQRRGARLFFTRPSLNGPRGAGCFACHSGPMLNKQVEDPDVTGVGEFVEQNFVNLGLGDHPLQALNRNVRGDPTFRDEGRADITGDVNDRFEFRVLTLRQLRDAGQFMHNGSFSDLKSVIEYFNAGVPQNAEAGATASDRFTHPRGPGTPRGLGLSRDEVQDLYVFVKDALYDPAFVQFDPNSTTEAFGPHVRDLTYSTYRPDLAALGALDGFMPSGLPAINNDPLSRRDMGLEFLNVTNRLRVEVLDSDSSHGDRRQEDRIRVTNTSSSVVDTHLLLMPRGLASGVRLSNASGVAQDGTPYVRIFLPEGVLLPGQSFTRTLVFEKPHHSPQATYQMTGLSGQGTP